MAYLNTKPDEFSRKFQKDLFPSDWKNPKPIAKYDLLVVGGGPGGMTAATVARGLNAQVALVEKDHLGGECLNFGCIPSKALLRSSRLAAEIRRAADFGFEIPKNWEVDFGAIMRRVHRLQAKISPHDSADHFKKLDIDVFLGAGRFIGPNQMDVGGQTITFKKAIIATGTQPVPLKISGLNESDYLTNQTIFQLSTLPPRIAVIGGGPIGCELSQAFLRFGSQVTFITHGLNLLPKDDLIATERLQNVLEKEGMQILAQSQVQRVEKRGKEKILYLDQHSKGIVVDEILVAIGRLPAIEGLNLEQAGVSYDDHKGISTNEFLQTTNPDIYAAGDVASKYKFTHISQELSTMAVENALKGSKERNSSLIIPWCTFTDPEVAHIGLNQQEAKEKGIPTEVVMVEMADIDRAIVDEETTGFMKLVVKENTDQIIGADIMASHAGDMIAEVSVAMACEEGLMALAKAIHPFPTQAQIIRVAAKTLLKRRENLVKTGIA